MRQAGYEGRIGLHGADGLTDLKMIRSVCIK
jgi:hypothetical protein